MSSAPNRSVVTAVVVYLLAYLAASFLDLSTTALALQNTGAREQNAFVTNAQAYVSERAWLITLAGGLVMAACVVFARRNAFRVESAWLEHPVRSFGMSYINPWSPRAIGRSPIHMLAFAISFVVLRVMAAANNVVIHLWGIAPIGGIIDWVGHRASPLVGFAVVIAVLFYLVAIAVSPFAAWIIAYWRRSELVSA